MGGNRWIDGTLDTLRHPVEAVTQPTETVTGALDAGALRFDEGVGGLARGVGGWASLLDRQAGNTAGSGTSAWGVPKDVADTFDSRKGGGFAKPAQKAVKAARNVGPDWLDEATGAGLVAVVLALLAYAFGQLFDVQL